MHTNHKPVGLLGPAPSPHCGLESLTRREREVLSLMAAGWSNEGIRDALVVSPKTVETHVGHIFVKLGVHRGSAVHPRVLAARMWLGAQAAVPGAAAARREVA
jgi:DNA-binding NarL/FixJ family response regulator